MNSHDSLPDDSHWSSLAQELGLDSEPSPKAVTPQSTPIEVHALERIAPHLIDLPDATDDDDTSIEPGLNGEAIVEGEEQPDDAGKRKRRRRRRRRKGGPATEGGNEEENAESGDEAEDEVEDEPQAEPKAPDLLRDVVTNWNVPSWEDLVGGLHRPGN